MMMSTDINYRIGQEVRELVSEKNQKIIERYPELFNIGLRGPDIFFSNKRFSGKQVNKTGVEFFKNSRRVVKKHHEDATVLSYLYGVICYYALTKTSPGYTDEKNGDQSTNQFKATTRNAEVVHYFYGNLTVNQIQKRLKRMVIMSKVKESLVFVLHKISGKEIDHTEKRLCFHDNARDLAVELIGQYHDYLNRKVDEFGDWQQS